jgi:hypothetical protein
MWRLMVSFRLCPIYSRRTPTPTLRYPLDRKLGGPQSRCERVGKERREGRRGRKKGRRGRKEGEERKEEMKEERRERKKGRKEERKERKKGRKEGEEG